jgi:hypothetical protein
MEDSLIGEYKIIVCENCHLIQHINSKRLVLIENSPFKISNYNCYEFSTKYVVKEVIICNAILGIILISDVHYIVYAKKVLNIGIIRGSDIFEIKEVEFYALEHENPNDLNTVENLKRLLSNGFYYSYTYDLTSSIQKQSKTKATNLLERIDKNYYWNLNLYKEFIHNKIDQIFFAVLICGYISINNYIMKDSNETLSFSMISRKLVHNSNKMSYATGLNEIGQAANYIESEQIMIFKNLEFSFVQARGSCPVFYEIKENFTESEKLEVCITRTPEKTRSPFIKHLKIMIKEYNFVYFINCLNANNENEKILLSSLEEMLKINDISLICKYDNDDFEVDEKNTYLHKLDTIILAMEKVFQNFKFFCYDSDEKKVICQQMGIVRTVCFDTNSKTNHIQKKISKKVFENFVS